MEDLLLQNGIGAPVSTGQFASAIPGQMQVLLVDEDSESIEHIRSMLHRENCRVSAFTNMSETVAILQRGFRPNIAFINYQLRGRNGTTALAWFREVAPRTPVVAISCSEDFRSIVEAMRLGAVDVLVEPFTTAELRATLQRFVKPPLTAEANHLREITLTPDTSFVFCSERMKEIAAHCSTIAKVDLPILILGESGTGKEILAQYIHQMSSCADRTFLKVNCAAMPADLLESELLGYEQGAFTGATKSKPGKFELCDQGTIFLDEIGEMPAGLQAKLLQVLQDGTFSRLGGRTTIKVNVRVIAATNINIKLAIAERRFREDLYYRLNGFSFTVPPLRERKEEIPLLIRYFIQKMAEKYARHPVTVSETLLSACVRYPWPGNVRELENFMKRFLVLGNEQVMMQELVPDTGFPFQLNGGSDAHAGGLKHMVKSLKGEAEAEAISKALKRNQWKHKQTATELKISYKALLYKIRQYQIIEPREKAQC